MRLCCVYPDGYVFGEPNRKTLGKNRLTIACHGFGHENGISHVKIDDQYCNPAQLAQHIEAWTEVNNYPFFYPEFL
ncbi:hypothetical protein Xkoz_00211 [Xenorhabdus kozodoii]|uniref:Uncharacterized protein n=1 Tax=Xenorhabdus kozodoii TaxID=351676 RepID=A0A2D0LHL2_9GAMM|nr:hypothetical protein Xkoz_00211 [Xenorhabdus kozodoii]